MKYVNVYIKPSNTLVTGQNIYNSIEEATKSQNPPLGTRFLEVAEVRTGEIKHNDYNCVGAYEGVLNLAKMPHKGDLVEAYGNTYRVDKVRITANSITLELELIKEVEKYYLINAIENGKTTHAFPSMTKPYIGFVYYFNGVRYKVLTFIEGVTNANENFFDVTVKRIN